MVGIVSKSLPRPMKMNVSRAGSLISLGISGTTMPPLMIIAAPRAMLSMPRVTIRAGTRSTVTSSAVDDAGRGADGRARRRSRARSARRASSGWTWPRRTRRTWSPRRGRSRRTRSPWSCPRRGCRGWTPGGCGQQRIRGVNIGGIIRRIGDEPPAADGLLDVEMEAAVIIAGGDRGISNAAGAGGIAHPIGKFVRRQGNIGNAILPGSGGTL